MTAAPGSEVLPLIALTGVPNCGKTSLFNAMTGTHQKVANYPGVTVEKKEGVVLCRGGDRLRVLDLPGAYSLNPTSPDEAITRDVLQGKLGTNVKPDSVIAVADATNLERNLAFVLELQAMGLPMVLAVNMMDLAERDGVVLDLNILARELGMPVVPTVAVTGSGVMDVVESACGCKVSDVLIQKRKALDVRARYAEVDRILKLALRAERTPKDFTRVIDDVVLHPVWGSLLLVGILGLVFQAVFTWAAPLQDGLESLVGWLGGVVGGWLPDGILKSLVVDGIFAGVGGVVVFLPQILILFFFVLFLEDCGYMARAAFLMDRLMSRVGLHGRAFLPLLSSFACAIPGMMAARTIANPRDRLTTLMIAPLMTCSARLPVYTLLIAAFVPNRHGLQGLVMLGLYVAAVVFGLAFAFLFKRTILKGPTPPFLLELPTYKLPGFRSVLIGMWERGKLFLQRAGTVILALSVLLWALAYFPTDKEARAAASGKPPILESYAGRVGMAIEPLLRPIGFDWRISVSLIPGFAAREVMVGALGTVYALEAGQDDASKAAEEEKLTSLIQKDWSLATALSLLAWYIFAPQCISTLAVARRETGSWGWTAFMFSYLLAAAYLASFVVYRLFA